MAAGFLQSFDNRLEVFSAGTSPAERVSNKAISVMKEEDIDISGNTPHSVDDFLGQNWDYVITVCDDAKETCPYFPGIVKKRIHIAFEDPAQLTGPDEIKLSEYRRIRDEIKNEFFNLYHSELKPTLEARDNQG
jgi:arsenate reductase